MREVLLILLVLGAYSAHCQEFKKIGNEMYTEDGSAYSGYYRTYHDNGQSKALYHFKEGKLDQGVFFYDNSGKLTLTGFYDANKPDGLWQSWDHKGNVLSSARYDRGRKTGEWIVRSEHFDTTYSLSYAHNELLSASKK